MQLGSCIAMAVAVVATALIRPLAWKPPYVAGAALEKTKKLKKKKILPAQQNSGAHEARSHWFVSFPSWPWTNRHFDSLLHHEALQDDSN